MARRRGLAEAKIIGIVSICQRVVYQKERPEADWLRGVNTVREVSTKTRRNARAWALHRSALRPLYRAHPLRFHVFSESLLTLQ